MIFPSNIRYYVFCFINMIYSCEPDNSACSICFFAIILVMRYSLNLISLVMLYHNLRILLILFLKFDGLVGFGLTKHNFHLGIFHHHLMFGFWIVKDMVLIIKANAPI